MSDCKITKYNDNTWVLEEPMVRMFLLTGTDSALLIDTCMNIPDARAIAQGLTPLPLRLLCTHGDPDHTGGNAAFDRFYMHPAEGANYYTGHGGAGTLVPVEEGDFLDLGGRPLHILALPGHTPGSIAVLDVNARLLFAGDTVQDFGVFMFGVQRDLHSYILSMKKLESRAGEFDAVLASHGTLSLSPSAIPALRQQAERILAGTADYTLMELHGQTVRYYKCPAGAFFCPNPAE